MPRAVRLIIYDFDSQEALDKQLGMSMNEGTRVYGSGRRITVVNVPEQMLRAFNTLSLLTDPAVTDAEPLPMEGYQAEQV